MIFIFDIDGTLADNSHRLHFINGEKKDWEGYHSQMAGDSPIWEVITVARALKNVVYSTGRMFKDQGITLDWLNKYRVPAGPLYMRPNDDHRTDYVVKSEILDTLITRYGKHNIGGAFEDRQQVVDMYRERGFRVFQVAKGDY